MPDIVHPILSEGWVASNLPGTKADVDGSLKASVTAVSSKFVVCR